MKKTIDPKDMKSERLTVACTAEQADVIYRLAHADNLTVSEFIHSSLFGFLD